MDLDFWDCSGRKKLCLITEEIRYHQKIFIRNSYNSLPVGPPDEGVAVGMSSNGGCIGGGGGG